MHQWGFAWQDGTLTGRRWRPAAMAAGGAALLAGLLTWGPFPVDMIGARERIGNTTPPSIALLAFAAAQAGLLLALEPAVSRLLTRPRLGRHVKNLNATVMTLYLWHMAPVIVIAVAFYPMGVMPQPAIGTAQWWELRPPGSPFSRRCWCRSSWRSCGRNGRWSACPPGSGHGGPVAAAPAARYRRLHGRPGQTRDRRIRPGRAPAGACPGGLRRRPARDPVHRPRPARYGLYYRSPLAEFGIVARAGTLLGDLPITVDVLTESDCAAHMAAGFRSAVEATEYFQRWMLSTDPLPAEILRDYAEVACLCRLPYLTDERDAVREAFFDGDLASTGIAPRPSPRCMEGARLAEARLRLIEGRLVQAGLPADRWLQVFKGFHRFLEVRKAVEIEAAFGVRLACPVDEHNSARHVSNDSPAQAPPSRDCPIFACHRPTARPGCLARRSAGSVAPRRARRPAPALPGAAGGPQAHAPARVRKAAGRPAFAGSPPAGRPDRPGHGPQLPRGAHRARTARFSSVSLRQAAARACGDVKSRKPW